MAQDKPQVTYAGPFVDGDGYIIYKAEDSQQVGYFIISYIGNGNWIVDHYSGLNNKLLYRSVVTDDLLPTGDMSSVWVFTDIGWLMARNMGQRGFTFEDRPRPWWYDLNSGYPAPVEWYGTLLEDVYYAELADRVEPEPEEFSIVESLAGALGMKLYVEAEPKKVNLGILERLEQFA